MCQRTALLPSRPPVSTPLAFLGRSPPGLAAQHLTCMQLVAQLCAGQLQGGAVGSSEVWLTPPQPRRQQGGSALQPTPATAAGSPLQLEPQPAHARPSASPASEATLVAEPTPMARSTATGGGLGTATLRNGGQYTADTGTAGSCSLLLQAALPCLLFAGNGMVSRAAASACSTQSIASSGGAEHFLQGLQTSERCCDDQRNLGKEEEGSPSANGLPRKVHGIVLALRGGTDAAKAPPFGYVTEVLLPTLHTLYGAAGFNIQVNSVGPSFPQPSCLSFFQGFVGSPAMQPAAPWKCANCLRIV
jgi:hypothetical protein